MRARNETSSGLDFAMEERAIREAFVAGGQHWAAQFIRDALIARAQLGELDPAELARLGSLTSGLYRWNPPINEGCIPLPANDVAELLARCIYSNRGVIRFDGSIPVVEFNAPVLGRISAISAAGFVAENVAGGLSALVFNAGWYRTHIKQLVKLSSIFIRCTQAGRETELQMLEQVGDGKVNSIPPELRDQAVAHLFFNRIRMMSYFARSAFFGRALEGSLSAQVPHAIWKARLQRLGPGMTRYTTQVVQLMQDVFPTIPVPYTGTVAPLDY